MIARHASRKGQPRRSWAPLPVDLLKDPVSIPEWHPTPRQVAGVLDQMDGDLWRAVVAGPLLNGTARRTTAEALEFLAPRRTPAKTIARGVRRLVGLCAFEVCVLAVIAVPLVLHAVGV